MTRKAALLLSSVMIIYAPNLASGLTPVQSFRSVGSAAPQLKPALVPSQRQLLPKFVSYGIDDNVRSHNHCHIYRKTWLNGENTSDEVHVVGSFRNFCRKLTGMSLSATRASIRATYGISLTAVRASLRAATGISISAILKSIMELFPLWARYFMQPFLVLYYAPLLILREVIGRRKGAKRKRRLAHEKVVDGFKTAVGIAEAANKDKGYWPVRVNEDGWIEAVLPPDPDTFGDAVPDVTDAITKSVILAASIESSES
eukprot:CAMPEP_0194378216 /NCGR_PEP_ID=MMETSP0174-20130528/34453_1 /TAXON_ID=216777 /ORGANISM="Proboscia alata, Strain PI-D3" /LENGTH=257 /DNA_ID=CAMNT_0039160065 /DNA_START=88 /DNA_END=861 /DNA_ORIENTATION=-